MIGWGIRRSHTLQGVDVATERADAHALSQAEEFYGLAHVVHVWRALDPEQRRVGAGLGPELQRILARADRYLQWVDRQTTVNESNVSATVMPMEPKEASSVDE